MGNSLSCLGAIHSDVENYNHGGIRGRGVEYREIILANRI